MTRWTAKLRVPLFTEIVRSRGLCITIAAISAVQLGLSEFTSLGLPCPFHATTHLPCPGCGLTRSVLAILRGEPGYSFSLHPFGYLLLLGLVMCLLSAVLPNSWRLPAIDLMEKVETRTGVTMTLLLIFMVLWAVRMTGVLPLAQV